VSAYAVTSTFSSLPQRIQHDVLLFKVISGILHPIGVVQTGCEARRNECRVASHTNEVQRRSAPVCNAKMG
ncbi:MAG TPA: hypothetical protein VM571_12980, partial [Noviherbaspirillum sp.]|nr:hypothetical protein [Noviherbaspirillum sp.]